MKYNVPLYKLVNNEEIQIGRVVVCFNSFGVFDINSNMKIHISSGLVDYKEEWVNYSLLSPFIKKKDLNGSSMLKANQISKSDGTNVFLVKKRK